MLIALHIFSKVSKLGLSLHYSAFEDQPGLHPAVPSPFHFLCLEAPLPLSLVLPTSPTYLLPGT